MNTFKNIFVAIIFCCICISCGEKQEPSLTKIESPAADNSQLPYLESDNNGKLFLSWVESDTISNMSTLLYSSLENGNWSTPQTIASSDGWFVNWADYPSIMAQNGTVKAAHVLNKTDGGTYSYNVNIYSKITDDTWGTLITPHFDNTATEHGFVSLAPWNDKTLAIWLDGRRTHERNEEEYYDITKAMTLRSAVIASDGSVSHKERIDESVCDCCNTAIAVTPQGAIAAYRNRTDDEVRDIFVSRYTNGQWSKPKAVHNDRWTIAACPVNGPAIAARDSTVLVAWFTAANNTPVVKAAISSDYGQNFGSPIIINDSTAIGRVDAVTYENGSGFVSWMEKSDGKTQLKVKNLNNGHTSRARTITEMNPSRSSGFPQMEIHGDDLVFAWTALDTIPKVKTAAIDLSQFD